jgi:hypothetical protein
MDEALEYFIDVHYLPEVGILIKKSIYLLVSIRDDRDFYHYERHLPDNDERDSGTGSPDGLREHVRSDLIKTLYEFGVSVNPLSTERPLFNLLNLLDELPSTQLLADSAAIIIGSTDSVETLCLLLEAKTGIESTFFYDTIHEVDPKLLQRMERLIDESDVELDPALLTQFERLSKNYPMPLGEKLYRQGVCMAGDDSFYRLLGTLNPSHLALEWMALVLLDKGLPEFRENLAVYVHQHRGTLTPVQWDIVERDLTELKKRI